MATEYDTMHRGRSSEKMRSPLVPRIYIPRRGRARRAREGSVLFPGGERRRDSDGVNGQRSETEYALLRSPMVYDRRRTDDDSSSRNRDRSHLSGLTIARKSREKSDRGDRGEIMRAHRRT